jgi:hypothetical protein
MDEQLRLLGIAQSKAGVKTIILTLQENGDVITSLILGPRGANQIPYARIDGRTETIQRLSGK